MTNSGKDVPPIEITSYDNQYILKTRTEVVKEVHFINIEIVNRNTEKIVYTIENEYRAFDFQEVTWEEESNNFWVKSGDLGIFCYQYVGDEQWEKCESKGE